MKYLSTKFSSILLFAFLFIVACKPTPKEEKAKPISNEPVLLEKIHLTNLPNFENIKPIDDDALPLFITDSIPFDQMQLIPAAILPEFDASIFDYNINGLLTPQAPYMSANAFIEVINGDYLTGENQVDCKCGNPSGVTYIKLVMNAKAEKIYILTVKAKPTTGAVRLGVFASGFLHEATIDDANQEFEMLFSSASNGRVDFWMQCANPNSGGLPWEFHSIEIQEVDRP